MAILALADYESEAVTAGRGINEMLFTVGPSIVTTDSKNGSYCVKYDGNTDSGNKFIVGHPHGGTGSPLINYPGWRWWAMGGWLKVLAIPDGTLISQIMQEKAGTPANNWEVGISANGANFNMTLFYNRASRGAAVGLLINTWYSVIWLMQRGPDVAQIWIDGTKVIDRAIGAEAPLVNPDVFFPSVELNAKANANSEWLFDTQIFQDDGGFENADVPILDLTNTRVPSLAKGATTCSVSYMNEFGNITLGSSPQEYLRAVIPIWFENVVGAPAFRFKECVGGSIKDYGFNTGTTSGFNLQTLLNRQPDGTRWNETDFNAMGFGGAKAPYGGGDNTDIDVLYAFIMETDESALGKANATRYSNILPS